MRRLLILLVLLLLSSTILMGQIDYTDFKDSYNEFSDKIATALPYLSTIGLNWSDAHLKEFPHFGIGITVGAVFLPTEAFGDVFDTFGVSIPGNFDIGQLGIPLPAYVVDARLGGFKDFFDLGFKVGFIWDQAGKALSGMTGFDFDYLLMGGDIRFIVLKDEEKKPGISIGLGYNYMRGGVSKSNALGSSQTIQFPAAMGLSDITVDSPDVSFFWECRVIDLKAQLSKKIKFFTPYIGFGGSYGVASAGGGLTSNVRYGGSNITQADIDAIKAAFESAGMSVPDVSAEGITLKADASGWSFRTFGGFSINIFYFIIDATAMWNFTSRSLGADLNLRFQF